MSELAKKKKFRLWRNYSAKLCSFRIVLDHWPVLLSECILFRTQHNKKYSNKRKRHIFLFTSVGIEAANLHLRTKQITIPVIPLRNTPNQKLSVSSKTKYFSDPWDYSTFDMKRISPSFTRCLTCNALFA